MSESRDVVTDVKTKKSSKLREWISLGALVLVLVGARASLADHYYVPSGSMLPTIDISDRIAVNKLAYGLRIPMTRSYLLNFNAPERGEVVVLRSPENEKVLLKRVIAVPGDVVAVRMGQLFFEGAEAPVHTTSQGLFERLGDGVHPVMLDNGGGPDFGPVRLPDDAFLVMGDNRGDSHDGRSFGFVRHDAFLGRAEGVFYSGGPTWEPL